MSKHILLYGAAAAMILLLIWLFWPSGTGGGGGGSVTLGDGASGSYAPGSLISVSDANAIYSYYVSQGQNQTDASNSMVNYVHAQGLLVPAGLSN